MRAHTHADPKAFQWTQSHWFDQNLVGLIEIIRISVVFFRKVRFNTDTQLLEATHLESRGSEACPRPPGPLASSSGPGESHLRRGCSTQVGLSLCSHPAPGGPPLCLSRESEDTALHRAPSHLLLRVSRAAQAVTTRSSRVGSVLFC